MKINHLKVDKDKINNIVSGCPVDDSIYKILMILEGSAVDIMKDFEDFFFLLSKMQM